MSEPTESYDGCPNGEAIGNRDYGAELGRTPFDSNTLNLKVQFIYTTTCSIYASRRPRDGS